MVPVKPALPLNVMLVQFVVPQNAKLSAVPSLLAVLLPDRLTLGALDTRVTQNTGDISNLNTTVNNITSGSDAASRISSR